MESTSGFADLVDELARVGGEGFDVAALSLAVEGVEGERTLARAAQARDDDELVARHVEAQVLEVMLARTPDADFPLSPCSSVQGRHELSRRAPPRKGAGPRKERDDERASTR